MRSFVVFSIPVVLACAACTPQASQKQQESTDGWTPVVVRDAAAEDHASSDIAMHDGAGRDSRFLTWDHAVATDTPMWEEEVGVTYESYLPCLSSTAITLASCYNDARSRASSAGGAFYGFARASATLDQAGQVPEDRAGLIYQFCAPSEAVYNCLSVEYWWSGVTAQITVLRLHNAREGAACSHALDTPPDSPQIMAAFGQTQNCDLGTAGSASVNIFRGAQEDQVHIVAAVDSLLLSIPALSTLDNACHP